MCATWGNRPRTMHTNKGRFRSLAASVMIGIIAIGGGGCSAKPEFSAEAFLKISAVTDRAMQIVQSTSAASVSDDILDDVRTLSDALLSALQLTESYRNDLKIRDRLDAGATADVLACLSANATMLPNFDVMLGKLGEALQSGDDEQIIGRQQMLTDLSRRAVLCAMLATETLSTLKSAEALDLVGVAIGPVYANAIAWQALNGLALDGLLERHAAANAIILARLAPRCARHSGDSAQPFVTTAPCVSYQLAKQSMQRLESALPARAHTTPNAIAVLTRITDSQIRLLDTDSERPSTSGQELEAIADAVKAAQGEIQRHSMAVRIGNRLDAGVYVKVKACTDSHAVLFENVSRLIHRVDALQVPNDAAAMARKSVFGVLAVDASRCAILATTYLDAVADLDAVDKLGMLVGELYAISFATERLAEAGGDGLLTAQLEAYQTVVNRLASRCDPSRRSALDALFGNRDAACISYQVAADALTKLSARNDSSRHPTPAASESR